MKLEWLDRETVFITDVGTVSTGTVFEIEDSRGQDLVDRKVAKIVLPKPIKKEMVERRDIHVVVMDGLDTGNQ